MHETSPALSFPATANERTSQPASSAGYPTYMGNQFNVTANSRSVDVPRTGTSRNDIYIYIYINKRDPLPSAFTVVEDDEEVIEYIPRKNTLRVKVDQRAAPVSGCRSSGHQSPVPHTYSQSLNASNSDAGYPSLDNTVRTVNNNSNSGVEIFRAKAPPPPFPFPPSGPHLPTESSPSPSVISISMKPEDFSVPKPPTRTPSMERAYDERRRKGLIPLTIPEQGLLQNPKVQEHPPLSIPFPVEGDTRSMRNPAILEMPRQ